MLEESPLENVSQDKNSNKKRKEKLNFQENLSKVLSFTLYFMISTKGWVLFIIVHGHPKVKEINKIN